MLRGALLAGMLVLVLAAPADATVTRKVEAPGGPFCDPKGGCSQMPPTVSLTGSAGADRVKIAGAGDNRNVIVEDPGGVVGCTPLSATTARCDLYGVRSIEFAGGDDEVSLAALPNGLPNPGGIAITIGGGPGNDSLIGSPGADRFFGDAGNDRLLGAAGGDFLQGDQGEDELDGGAGTDTATYEGAAGLDLTRIFPNGVRGENDTVRFVERAEGGPGSSFTGDDGPNSLLAEGPGSKVVGRGGDDSLSGSIVDAGPGDDYIGAYFLSAITSTTKEVDRSRVSCGPGRDVIAISLTVPSSIAPDCERITDVDMRLALFLTRRSSRGVIARVAGLDCVEGCRVQFTLRGKKRRVLGVTKKRFKSGTRRMSVRLNAAGRRAFRRHKRNAVGLEVKFASPSDEFVHRYPTTLLRR